MSLTNYTYIEEIILALVLAILICIAAYAALNKEKSLINKFTSKFSVFTSLFIPIGIYLTYKVFSDKRRSMNIDATYTLIDRGWLNINKDIVDYYKECPNFMNSLYFDWQKKVLGKVIHYKVKDNWQTVNYMSIKIFQAWEDFIESEDVQETGDTVWLNNFLQWANSDILRKNWSVLKTNFSETTIQLGDVLFYNTQIHKPKNSDELNELAMYIYSSDEFKNIIANRYIK